MKGTIKRFYFKKGFGFIENAEGEELFFHYSDFDGPKKLLRSDTQVEFSEAEGDKGLYAVNIQIEGYDPGSDSNYRQAEKKTARNNGSGASSNNTAAGEERGNKMMVGLVVGLILGAAAGYFIALNMPMN